MTKEERRNAIRVLIVLRETGFRTSDVHALLATPQVLVHIKELAVELGSKFIRQELESEGKQQEFLLAKKHFNDIVLALQTVSSLLPLLHFSSDLLQFYVLASEPKWQEQNTTTKVTTFLNVKRPITGNCAANLFVLELKVLTMYNELVTIQASFDRHSLSNAIVESNLVALTAALATIKQGVAKNLANSPDNTFALYLSFAINYTYAKMIELQFQINEHELSEAEKLERADVQSRYLQDAAENLTQVNKLQTLSKETSQPFTMGEQYCFGRSLLRKFPLDSLELMTQQIVGLTANNT